MSLSRDDLGLGGSLNTLQSKFVETRTVENQSISSEKVNDSDSSRNLEESVIRDVYEKKQQNFVEVNGKLINHQNEYNSLEQEKNSLTGISDGLKKLGEVIEDQQAFSEEEVEKVIEQLNKDNNPEAVDKKTLEELGKDVKSQENSQETSQKINDLKQQVSQKQQEIANLQQEIIKEVNSIVELDVEEDSITDYDVGEQGINALKQSVTDEIKENPESSRKIQIKNINKNLILAMISLRIN